MSRFLGGGGLRPSPKGSSIIHTLICTRVLLLGQVYSSEKIPARLAANRAGRVTMMAEAARCWRIAQRHNEVAARRHHAIIVPGWLPVFCW